MRRDVIGLVYHSISDRPPAHLRHLYPIKTRQMFEQDLIYLKRHGNVISYDELWEHVRGGQRIKPNSVLLTFDDGYSECYGVIRPMLLEHGVPAVFFITTDFIDNKRMFYRNKSSLCTDKIAGLPDTALQQALSEITRRFDATVRDRGSLQRWIRGFNYTGETTIDQICELLEIDVDQYLKEKRPYLTSDQIQTLVADGFTVGAHSRRHPKLNLLSETEMAREIVSSCAAAATLAGGSAVPFAFPFSGQGVDRDFLAKLRDRHTSIGIIFDSQGVRPDRSFIRNRVWADPPPENNKKGSNLARLLHNAYIEYTIWRRRYIQSMLGLKVTGPIARWVSSSHDP